MFFAYKEIKTTIEYMILVNIEDKKSYINY